MSSYLCDAYHIGQIGAYVAANVRVRYLPHLIDYDVFNAHDMRVLSPAGVIARALAHEHIASLDHLHSDTGGAASFLPPHTATNEAPPATLTDFIVLCIQQSRLPPDPAIHPATWWDVFSAYEYQACGHPRWRDSVAHRIVERARRIAGDAMAEKTNAPGSWALERDQRPLSVPLTPAHA